MMGRTAMALLRREFRIAWGPGSSTGLAIGFFVIVVALFPFAVGSDPALLARISAGILWVAALLAAIISLDRLFADDFEDGSFDQIALSPLPLEAVALIKSLAHWITTTAPIILVTPLVAILLNLPDEMFIDLLLSLVIGTPALSFIGAIGAALTLAMRRAGTLVSVLVLPLYIPILIFGVSAVSSGPTAGSAESSLAILAALTLASLALAPFAAAAALRLAIE